MLSRTNVTVILAAAFAASAYARSRPNFSGTWKLSASQSEYGDKRAAVPDSLIWKVNQLGDHFTYTVEGLRQGKKNGFTAEVEIGGRPYESDEAGIITARWKGNNLVVDTLYNPDNDRRSSIEEMWILSEDGAKLTDNVVYHVPKTAKNQADVIFKRVFDKQ